MSLFDISSDVDPESNVENSENLLARPSFEPVSCVVRLPIKSLLAADSPRLSGENMEHVRTLAESEESFPPIIVHRATMCVIDGMHRLRAAMLRNQEDIEVQLFDGDTHDAFVLAVKANITHGLPLSLADRTAAAARIIDSHPQWSDRAIASTVGLAAKTVAAIRRRSTAEDSQSNIRIGLDGKVRPLSAAEGRRVASELMTDRPDASLREIASAAGISLGTAQDVRDRLRRGADPVPSKQRKRDEPATRPENRLAMRTSISDRVSILDQLKKDPSIRQAHSGRVLLHLMHILAIGTREWEQLISNVPAHCKPMVSSAARACAEAWREFEEQLERH